MKEDNTAEVRRVTLVGMFINILLVIVKLVVGILGNSRALIADAVHSASDFSTDIAILIGSRYWSLPPDSDHPYGHRRIETLMSIIIGLVLASVGVFLIFEAIEALRAGKKSTPSLFAAAVAFFAIIIKEWLYRYTLKVGKRIKSSATMANAWHHRSDALSSIPVVIAILAAYFFPQLYFLDAIGAILVSVFILQAAFKIAWPGIAEVIDRGASREVEEKLRSIAKGVSEVESVHELRTRYSGGSLYVDLHIVLSPKITLKKAHDIGNRVRDSLLVSGLDILEVLIHLDPHDDSEEDAEIANAVSPNIP
jgi:cation diffusion facilitator family transporter